MARTEPVRLMMELFAGQKLPEWNSFADQIATVHLARSQSLFEAGEHVPFLFVVNTGVIRLTHTTPSGSSRVFALSQAGEVVASLPALGQWGLLRAAESGHGNVDDFWQPYRQQQATMSATAVVDSTVFKLPFKRIDELSRKYVPWAQAMITQALVYAAHKERRQLQLQTLTPEERYQQVITQQPGLIEQCPLRDIASLLAITPESLSRIRARMS